MSDYWRAQTLQQLENCFRFLKEHFPEKGLRIIWEEWRDQRSINANNLYWQWLTLMAKHFSKGDNQFTKEDMHDLMRHRFLGYVDRKIGRTEIKQQLASTASLDTAQMYHYMCKVDAWAADHGILLPRPEDAEYAKYREAAA